MSRRICLLEVFLVKYPKFKGEIITYTQESLHPAIREVLDLPYKYTQGPEQVVNPQDGVNCVWVAHRLADQLCGVRLPQDLDPVHMILDNPYLRTLAANERLALGDIFFVAQPGIREFRAIPEEIKTDEALVQEFIRKYPGPHVAVFTGLHDWTAEPILVHGNYVDKKVSVWPYFKFWNYTRYKKEYAIKRPVRTG